jgi:hypothetical protein
MALINGICKNCGSLIVTDDRDEMCECLFCDCFFPTSEAVEIAKHPEDYTFPNEPQPKREGAKRYSAVPVYPDPVPVAVKQTEASDAVKKKEKNPYEVSADDVKAPKKTLWTIIAITVAFVLVVVAIFLPLYLVRMNHRDAMSESIDQVFEKAGYTVNTEKKDGYPIGYSMKGQSNSVLRVVTTDDEIEASALQETYEAFAALRASEYGYDRSDPGSYYGDLQVEILAGNGRFIIQTTEESDGTQSTDISVSPPETGETSESP